MNLENFCNKIDYKFKDESLLEEALTHPSFSRKSNLNYQRLEFLGDKVLSLIISEFLFSKYKDENEGDLSKRHAFLVSGESLAKIASKIGINQVIKVSYGEKMTGGCDNRRNLENALEALIGAIYCDSNYQQAQKFILKFFQELLTQNYDPPKDPVSKLQEFVQIKSKQLPIYTIEQSGGSQHDPNFEAQVDIEYLGVNFKAMGKSKKEAQKNVAEIALQELKIP